MHSAEEVCLKEHILWVFENWVLRRMFGSEREEEAGEDCIMRSFITWYASSNVITVTKSRMMR
jgi:hypothetical protein